MLITIWAELSTTYKIHMSHVHLSFLLENIIILIRNGKDKGICMVNANLALTIPILNPALPTLAVWSKGNVITNL